MRLKPGLPATPYAFPRGRGPASIPNTTGGAGGGLDLENPLSARPGSACFWDKSAVLASSGLAYEPGRIFLGRVDGKMIGLADNRHIVTVAGSRGGKTACLLIPNLRMYPGSALVIDPKGELAAATAKDRAAMGQAVHVLDPWGVSGVETEPFRASLDPLRELRQDADNLTDNAELIADALVFAEGSGGENTFWVDAARGLVRALILWAFIDADGKSPTLASLPGLIADAAASMQSNDAGGLLQRWEQFNPEDGAADAILHHQAVYLLGLDERPRSSIVATAKVQLQFLESPALGRALASSALLLGDLKRQPCTVYLCLPASRMGTHSRWLRLILNLALAALEAERTTPPHPVLFVLEEFAALGHMRSLEHAVAYMAGFGVKLWAVLQDLTQLKRHYKEGWETFLGNAGVIQAFNVVDMTTLEHLSKMLGDTTIQITNKQDVSSSQAMAGDTGLRREFRTQRLLNPDEIAIQFARVADGKGGSAGGLTLVKVAGVQPFAVDRVFHGELEQ